MSSRPLVLACIGVLLGAVVGYALARPPGASAASVPPAEVGARVREILSDSDVLRRAAELGALLPRVGPDGIDAVREAYDASALDGGDLELVLLVSWWARFDPEAALRWTSSDWRGEYVSVVAAVFRSWAHSDPRRAYARAQSLRFQVQRDLSMEAAIVGWDESGQPGLLEFVAALPEDRDRQVAMQVLARRRVVSLGAQQAFAWVAAQDAIDGSVRKQLEGRIASAAADVDPRSAAAWAEQRLGGERPTGLPRRVGTRWIRSDAPAAMEWLASLPAGADRDDGVAESFRDWANRDPKAAGEWIQSIEFERWNEPAQAIQARRLAGASRYLEGLGLSARLSDRDLRDGTTTVIARAWLAADREAADAWIQQADLPEGVRKSAYMVTRPRSGPFQADGTAAPAPGLETLPLAVP